MSRALRPSDDPENPAELARAHRPQFLALMLLGFTVYQRPLAMATSSVIGVLADFDISSHAVRATLNRMTDRGLLTRVKRSREVFYALTAHGSAVLADGHAAAHEPPDRQWDGSWTVLGFTVPEDQRAVRHQLRSRLTWRGFGLLRNGMWIAPGQVDVEELLSDLRIGPAIRAFAATPVPPTDNTQLINDAFDLEAIASRYRTFIARWEKPDPADAAGASTLTRILLLQSEWAQIARADPRLPVSHLPSDWPALSAFRLYHELHDALEPQARQECASRTRLIDTGPGPVG
ncbi:PaaX family transcriptional regulator C-terminal domain-containing protein [Streptomyces sp. MMS24-I2-30]|uniref:PaaX family transcriptional regulator n=1 Tax=Streptomyces sp. MMS24-I2-30 TaxID=3351564 RepID=UPI003896D9D6